MFINTKINLKVVVHSAVDHFLKWRRYGDQLSITRQQMIVVDDHSMPTGQSFDLLVKAPWLWSESPKIEWKTCEFKFVRSFDVIWLTYDRQTGVSSKMIMYSWSTVFRNYVISLYMIIFEFTPAPLRGVNRSICLDVIDRKHRSIWTKEIELDGAHLSSAAGP